MAVTLNKAIIFIDEAVDDFLPIVDFVGEFLILLALLILVSPILILSSIIKGLGLAWRKWL